MLKLLIVDDDQLITRSLKRSMKRDFDIITANTVEEGILNIEKADVVLTDWSMPGGGGSKIVSACNTHNKPVVIMSAMPPYDVGVPTITKPAGIQNLVNKLTRAWESSK